jgi:ribosomal protein S6--L-glutamate ligase/tetrahydromethanopterin:alpha-L-glutamate ligase
MRLGLLTRNPRAWCSRKIVEAMEARRIPSLCFSFSDLYARIAFKPELTIHGTVDAVRELDAVIVRPIGRGSLDEVIFRLDVLHRMERQGLPVINPPNAIEKAVDKYRALTLLEENGIQVPRTVVTENDRLTVDAARELGGDVVMKPVFGSRGMGITRVSDEEIVGRISRTLAFHHHVLYLQQFIPHGTRDIRAFVVGDAVVAAMHRVGSTWKTNVSQGADAVPLTPTLEIEDLAVSAAQVLGCEVAGVDILEGPDGYMVNEINSQPGFRGLQSSTQIDVAGAIVDHVLDRHCR